jgi:mRNA interferase HicA
MNRTQFIQAIRKLARKTDKHFDLDKTKGKGSHYTVYYGEKWTTVQSELTPSRIKRILLQLDIDPADI